MPESVGPNWEAIKKLETQKRQEKEDDANVRWKGLFGEAGEVQYSPAIAQ